MDAPMTVGRIEFGPAVPYSGSYATGWGIPLSAPQRPPVAANDNDVGPKLIGLMGYGGAGKTTVANILRRNYGFAGPHIKEPIVFMARELLASFGIRPMMIVRYLDGDLKRETIPEIGRSGTEIQQFLGTEFGRDFCRKTLWVDRWMGEARRLIAAGVPVVQESVRFVDEASAIRKLGGLLVRVDRPGVGPLPGGHSSESLPAAPDVVVANDGSIEDLRSRIRGVLAA